MCSCSNTLRSPRSSPDEPIREVWRDVGVGLQPWWCHFCRRSSGARPAPAALESRELHVFLLETRSGGRNFHVSTRARLSRAPFALLSGFLDGPETKLDRLILSWLVRCDGPWILSTRLSVANTFGLYTCWYGILAFPLVARNQLIGNVDCPHSDAKTRYTTQIARDVTCWRVASKLSLCLFRSLTQ